jgi:hypothetical protein
MRNSGISFQHAVFNPGPGSQGARDPVLMISSSGASRWMSMPAVPEGRTMPRQSKHRMNACIDPALNRYNGLEEEVREEAFA